jgi:bifunctional DNase/RNase
VCVHMRNNGQTYSVLPIWVPLADARDVSSAMQCFGPAQSLHALLMQLAAHQYELLW